MKCFFIILFIGFTAGSVAAQSSSNKKALKAYKLAQDHLASRQYEPAMAALYEAIAEDPAFTEAYQVLGDIFRLQKNYENAVTNYRKVLELQPGFSARTKYNLGVSLFHLGAYAEAKPLLEGALPEMESDKRQLARLHKYIANCRFAETAIKSPLPFEPKHLGAAVNSAHDEYLPAITVDGNILIFTRKDQRGEDFYLSRQSESWQPAEFLSQQINTPVFNEGAESISPDGQTLFFTICGKPDGMGSCDIYFSRLNGNEWSAPLNLGEPVNSPAWESQPSLSPDGKTLYFASNRDGTLGGIDLWTSTMNADGVWSEPQNLGPAINTAYEEQSPFIHPDNQTLYFTSEGWPGMGGKDIFFSRKTADGWQEAENIGYPVNTVKDESSLVVSADGGTAYFASNSLEGMGGYDLYTFEMPSHARPVFVSYIKGKVVDAASSKPLSARIELIDMESGELLFSSHSNKLDGAFLASLPAGNDYVFNVSAPGYLFHSGSFFLEDQTVMEPYQLEIGLTKIASGEKVVLNNIFFETDSYKLKPASNIELDKVIRFMRENPNLVIEISGHTDNVGSDEYNLELSESRAKAVYAYLVRGILKPERFRFKGYGESQPVAGNEEEEGRAKNRRTELKVVSP